MSEWDAISKPATAGEWDAVSRAAPPEAGLATKVGRTVASLADTMVGDVPGALLSQVSYPFFRPFTSAEKAAEITNPEPFRSPFGKAFGVTETPEYQGEASRRAVGWVGEKFGEVSNALAQRTGLPSQDVQNMLGNAALAAPGAAKAVKGKVDAALAPGRSAADWTRASKIEAAQAAQRLDISLNPAESNPTAVNKMAVSVAGTKSVDASVATRNAPRLNEIARQDAGIPPLTPLTDKAFEKALAAHDGPYNRVGQMGPMTADPVLVNDIRSLKVDPAVIGSEAKAEAVNGFIDKAADTVQNGMNGELVLESLRHLRHDANLTFRRPDAKPADLARAEAQMAVANKLESLIESNITDPIHLAELRAARTAKAKIHDWQRATSRTTLQVDPGVIRQLAEKDRPLSGPLLDIANIMGNYPESLALNPTSPGSLLSRYGHGSVGGGGVGSLIGWSTGGPVGAAVGGMIGYAGGKGVANVLATKPAQNLLATPKDRRLPL